MKAPNWTFKFDPFLVQIWLKIDPILSKICEPEIFTTFKNSFLSPYANFRSIILEYGNLSGHG